MMFTIDNLVETEINNILDKLNGEDNMNNKAKKEPGRALYIGRFQGFHYGHLDVLKQIEAADDVDEIIIGIGSSQYDYLHPSPEAAIQINPFTYEERKQMIYESIKDVIKKPVHVYPIPDFHNCPKWLKYIEDNLPRFDVYYTNTKREIEVFESNNHKTRRIKINFIFHAGPMREWLGQIPVKYSLTPEVLKETMQKYNHYGDLMPEPTRRFFQKMNAGDRIRSLYIKANSGELD